MSSIWDWSLQAASNANSDDNINWQEGQPPSTVNNSARSMMQRVRELLSDLGAVTAATGTANVISFAAKSTFNTYIDGIRIALRAANTNTGSATLNVNSVGAKPIYTVNANSGVTPLSGGNITANGIYELIYSAALDGNSGGWLLLNPTMSFKPVGSYEIMAAPVVPAGYLYCDGRAVSRTTYASLFNVIGTRFGAGDGSTTFLLPDWRGAFMRGWDDGRGLDSGRVFGVQQNSQNKAHTHTFSGTTTSNGSHTHPITNMGLWTSDGSTDVRSWGQNGQTYNTGAAGDHTHTFSGTTSSDGGTDARPINNTVYVVVKF
ncbi:phage tail protein [Ochrobactrum chromiisoli]|uniref:Tail fiber protein n=1 Tax=Ochrobactrum chromiisoli TaxID=2993941 RepID=A0ABT3QUS6_9HYPH|nr:tail fiber protein [Ochrobactrum chromiisoli]MCX2699287.1 tail fiber protein [Ochrobactrum chromiisoli]